MGARRLLVLVSRDSYDKQHVDELAGLLHGAGASLDAVVLRWKGSNGRAIVDAARALTAVPARAQLLLSERFDLARAAGLDGVQLPEDGLAPDTVRALWPQARIGASRHDSTGIAERVRGADFVLLSPVFPTPSKPGHPGLGLERFARLADSSPVPVLAMGGVSVTTTPAVLAAGACGVAVRSEILDAPDPIARARAFREALDSAVASSPDDQFVPGTDGRVRPE